MREYSKWQLPHSVEEIFESIYFLVYNVSSIIFHVILEVVFVMNTVSFNGIIWFYDEIYVREMLVVVYLGFNMTRPVEST